MTVQTFSQFWYLDAVDEDNFYLPFNEGAGEILAEVTFGDYTVTTITSAIQTAMNTVGGDTYTVTFDRDTRKYTISSTGTFSLLISSGSVIGFDIFSLIGFSGSDTSSASSHTSNASAGSVFSPQFKLQDYTSTSDFVEQSNSSVSKTASGLVEAVSFGTDQFAEFSIMFATDVQQPSFGPVKNNASGISDLRSFMNFAITKSPFEFIIDESDIDTFETLLLEKTPQSGNGTSFILKEMTGKGLSGYYETGKLTLRKVS